MSSMLPFGREAGPPAYSPPGQPLTKKRRRRIRIQPPMMPNILNRPGAPRGLR